jgi:hypothetical protein
MFIALTRLSHSYITKQLLIVKNRIQPISGENNHFKHARIVFRYQIKEDDMG